MLAVAQRRHIQPAQAILLWALQAGVAVSVSSSKPKNIHSNFAVLDMVPLGENDYAQLNAVAGLMRSPLNQPSFE